MNAKQPIKASAAYESAHMVARDLLRQIESMLDHMPKPDDSINWAHVGDVCKVNADLCEIGKFLGTVPERRSTRSV